MIRKEYGVFDWRDYLSNHKDLKHINMVLPSNFKLDDLNNSETLIDIIEASIINLIEREINKTKLSEKDKIDLNTIFTNVRNKTLN